MAQLELPIEGMSCGSCAARVQVALSAVAGVERADVNLLSKRATITGQADPQALKAAVQRAGYKVGTDQEGETVRLRRELIVAVVLGLPVFVISMLMMSFPGSEWVQLVLSAMVLAGPARHIFQRAFQLARYRSMNMDTLIALGAGAAFLFSIGLMARGERVHLYFESAVVIIGFIILGKFLEEKAKSSAMAAIKGLAKLQPRTATVLKDDGTEEQISITMLKKGDRFLVAAGDAVATDGEVIDGRSEFDEALVSGESMPILRCPGDTVIGATINVGAGRVVARASGVGKDTMLAGIIRMVEGAQAAKPPIQKLADRVASVFVPVVVVIALVTFFVWWILGSDLSSALMPAVAVLVIACPCALGLATPTAVMAGTGRAAQSGVLVRSPQAFENAEKLTAVIVDKTGTITTGKPAVTELLRAPGAESGSLKARLYLDAVRAVEASSRHPVAKAVSTYIDTTIREELSKRPSPDIDAGIRPRILELQELAGLGIAAKMALGDTELEVLAGSRKLLERHQVKIPTGWTACEERPESLVFTAVAGEPAMLFLVTDVVRPTSRNAVDSLQAENLRVIMATGDRKSVAEAVGRDTGITEIHANLTPGEKLDLIHRLQTAGQRVAMVGDGLNDAPALAAADVGIAMGSGTEIAIETAGLVLPRGDLAHVAVAVHLARSTMRVIRQNLFWAFMYNVIAIPIAAFGYLSPMIAAGAMACSSVSVVANSLRLRRM